MAEIQFTPEIIVTQETSFLIRINNVETFFADSKADSKLIIDSIAAENVVKLENEWTKAFRRDHADGKKITISTQALGVIMDGNVLEVMTIDFIPVLRAKLIRGRHERQDRYIWDEIDHLLSKSLLSQAEIVPQPETTVKTD